MTSSAVPVGGVPGTPPPPGEPESRASTPVPGQTHDIVIGGVGFTLYRANTDDNPSKVYTSEAVDYSYAPNFIVRNNGDGSWNDDQQDFYMNATQRDFSQGEGQKYFRRGSADSGYWAGGGIIPTIPGQVRMTPQPLYGSYSGSTFTTGGCQVTLYVKGTGQIGSTNEVGDALVRVGIPSSATTILFQYSQDGGASWTTQTVSSASTNVKDTIDACLGDDGYVYVLEGTRTSTQGVIHRIKAPSLASAAWDNWTAMNKQANCIAYGGAAGTVYVGDSAGRLVLHTSSGGAGTVAWDFGGGVITQILQTPEGYYLLYLSPQGTYKVFLYTSGKPQEVLNLPRGWKQNFTIESGEWPNRTASGIFAMASQAMVWSEGVLYIAGMMPARDHQQSRRGEASFHSALYYYSAGNSGFVWECELAPRWHHNFGSTAACAIHGGMIAWTDGQNGRIMCYDPRTGGVFCLAGNDVFAPATLIMGGTTTGTITTAMATNVATSIGIGGLTAPIPGTILRNDSLGSDATKGERIMVEGGSGGFSGSSPYTVKRGFNGTYAQTTSWNTNGNQVAYDVVPQFPVTHMCFDFTNGSLLWDYQGFPIVAGLPLMVGGGLQPYLKLRQDDVGSLGRPLSTTAGVYPNSWLQTSIYDFDSSLTKYVRDVQLDFDSKQLIGRIDEVTSGYIYGWMKADGVTYRPPHDPFALANDDLLPINGKADGVADSTTIVSGASGTTAATFQLQLASVVNISTGTLLYTANSGFQTQIDYGVVTAISGSTVTIGRRWFLGSGPIGVGVNAGLGAEDGTFSGWNTGATVYVHPPISASTRTLINVSCKSIQYHFEMVGGPTATGTPISLGPILKKIITRAIPVQTSYRLRTYQIAMFNHQPRISGGNVQNVPLETRTPAELKSSLESMFSTNTPVAVSDSSMSSTVCSFILDDCKIREVRPNEYIAYVTLREV